LSPIYRPCVQCGRLIEGRGRCPEHEAAKQAAHNAGRVARYHKSKGHRERRARVLQRDGFTCHWCGGEANECDYVVPLSRGGEAVDSNAVAACRACNAGRHARLARQA
jgi:5-methylcytosine-specific restriction endonuclease McrA